MKKRLGCRIIPTIGLSTHTLYIAVALEDLAKTGASILDASIRMDHQTRFRFPLLPCSLQGFKHESMIERSRQRPADDLTREQINKDRQIHPTLLQTDVGNVADPYPIGALDLEATPEAVGRDRKGVLRLGGHSKAAAHDRAQAHRFHPFRDPIFANFPVFGPQGPRDFRAARPTTTGLIEALNRLIQPLGFLRLPTGIAFLPGIKPTARHRQYTAHLPNTPPRAVPENKAIAIHYRPSEKMASAFFSISRSRRSRSFSRCKWRTCSSWTDKWPLPGKASAPSSPSGRFQREIIPWLRPKRRSTSVARAPSSLAIRIASSLNSRSYFPAMDTPP